MSALNVLIDEKAALVGVDTLGLMPDGALVECLKMVSLHHVNAVIAFRGTDFVFMSLMPTIVGFKGSIEELSQMLPSILPGVVEHCRGFFKATEAGLGFDIALCGFSEAQGRAVGYLFQRSEGSNEISASPIHSRFRSPYLKEWDAELSGIPCTREGMVALTHRQSELSVGLKKGFGVGGRLFIAEVGRDRIAIEMAATFP